MDAANSETSVSVGDSTWTGQASIKRLGNSDSAVSIMVPKGRSQPPRIRLRLDGPPSHEVDIFDGNGMDFALSIASGIPTGSVTFDVN